MLEDVLSHANKHVVITLTNGKEKKGIIKSIDIDSNTIRLKDEQGNPFSLLISMIGMIEPLLPPNVSPPQAPVRERVPPLVSLLSPEAALPPPIASQAVVQVPVNVSQKITIIQITYDTGLKNAQLTISNPNFETPAALRGLGYYDPALRTWTKIKNHYDSGVKLGRLVPNGSSLISIIQWLKELAEIAHVSKVHTIYTYLGYFQDLNHRSIDAIRAYKMSAELSDKPDEWLNLAVVAIKKDEIELACDALENFFTQVSCVDPMYENAWFKLVKLLIQCSAYERFKILLKNHSLRAEQEKIFDAVCYCLLKAGQQTVVESYLMALQGQSQYSIDYQKNIFDMLAMLPKEGSSTYVAKLESIVVPPVVIPQPKPIASFKLTDQPFIKDSDLAREARKHSTSALRPKQIGKFKQLF